ncbi:MAG TPA: VWA domain-containing protein [Terriglobia bacterium]|nr:VWA domain-containing protein [Terriglobia bacterium]
MCKTVLGLFSTFLALLLLPQTLFSQRGPRSDSSQNTGTIKVGTAEVLVDAIVTDKRNRLISNMKPRDFEIFEDGVPQDIDSFSLHRGAPAPSPQSSAPLEAKTGATEAAPPPATQIPNLTILLLDYSTTEFQNEKLVQEASVKYVEQKLQPGDLMAVFVLGAGLQAVTNFTDDKTRLIAALKSRNQTGSALSADRADLTSGVNFGEATTTSVDTSATASLTTSGPGAAGVGAALGAQGSAMAQVGQAQRIAAAFYVMRSGIDQRQSRAVLTAIRAIAGGVKQIEGRKTLILFSQGFVVGESIEPELHSVADAANRAHLAVYCIDTRGLESQQLRSDLLPIDELTASARVGDRNRTQGSGGETIFDKTLQAGRDMNESALRFVANATGGFYVHNTNDLETGLDRIDDEMRSYYLLTYHPKNQNFDGKFRQIRVEARPPGLTVRARNGYYAIPAGFDFLTPDEFQVLSLARTAGDAKQLPVYMRAGGFQEDSGEYRVPIILEIPARGIQMNRSGQTDSAKLQIIGMVRDSANNLVARFGGPVNLNMTEGEYKALEPGNVSFVNSLQLPAGKAYTFEVAVKDLSSGMASDRAMGLFLRSPGPGLALSTILLAKDVDKASNAGSQFLTVEGVKILPTAQCEFHNGDNLIFYFDIYRPQLEAQKADVSVDLILLRDGNRVNVQLPRFELNQSVPEPIPHITLARFIQLAGLQAGNYSLVFQVKDAFAKKVESAQVAFTVAN